MLSIPWGSIFSRIGIGRSTADDRARPVALEPPPLANADRAQLEAMTERLSGMLAARVLDADSEESALAEIDAVLRAGGIAQYMRPVLAIASRSEGFAALVEQAQTPPDMSHISPEAARLALEAWELQRHSAGLFFEDLREMAKDAEFDAFLMEHRRDPMAFLHELPVEIAELALASERGRAAGFTLYARGLAWFEVPLSRDLMLARLYWQGAWAEARLFASLLPDEFPTSMVPTADRLDLVAIRDAHRAAEARAEALFAEAEASGLDVYEPTTDA
ncbi:MAG: hypothetical protein J0L92_00960 [Deltaproteobacteria bacterium]|nr:hypothetical protein [Deltaproteobacteria bacterium]